MACPSGLLVRYDKFILKVYLKLRIKTMREDKPLHPLKLVKQCHDDNDPSSFDIFLITTRNQKLCNMERLT